MNKQLHTDPAGKECFISRLAHFKQKLDTLVLLFPRQHIWITLNNNYVDKIETLLVVLGVRTRLQIKEMVADSEPITRVDLRCALELQARRDLHQ